MNRKIKSFISFNENIISDIKSYKDALYKYDKIDKEDFEDRLVEITDLGVNLEILDPRITNDKGHPIAFSYFNTIDSSGKVTNKDEGKYFLSYFIKLTYDSSELFLLDARETPFNLERYNKKISYVSNIINTIFNVINKISSVYNLKIDKSIVHPIIRNTSDGDVIKYTFSISLNSNEISIDEIKKISSEYNSTTNKKCHSALNRIHDYLEKRGIKNPNIDFNWDMIEEIESGERDDIPCGFFTDEEIIVIANYNPKSNDIEYDEPEVSRAIQAYNNGDMSR